MSAAEDIAARLATRAAVYAEGAVESLDIEEVSADDMEAIAKAIAQAFILGYAAAGDDARPARPLGGVNEARLGRGRKVRR